MIQHMVLMDPCGNTGNEHQHRLQLPQDHGPRHIQQQQLTLLSPRPWVAMQATQISINPAQGGPWTLRTWPQVMT